MAKRIVIKIGTNLLTEKLCGLRADFISKIAKEIAELKKKGNEILIVTSGAIGAGCTELGVKKSREVEVRQALAAVGQSYVMRAYADAFSKFKLKVAQILLTYDDFSNRKRYLNLKKAIDKLLELKVIPIINENDPISVDEIGATFGDNDKLSALVASKVNAELLILLTDIDGFYDKNPKTNKLLKSKISKGLEMSEKQSFSEHTPKSKILDDSKNFQNDAKLIKIVENITRDIEKAAGKSGSAFSIGGMLTKIKAAKIAMDSGCNMVICNGRKEGILEKAINGREGTLFVAKGKLSERERWIKFSKAAGKIVVNDCARKILLEGKCSLLAVGIDKVQGDFKKGDVVEIGDIAKGISDYSSKELDKVKGKKGRLVVKSGNIVLV